MKLSVSIIGLLVEQGKFENNYERIKTHIIEAASQKIRLIVFPQYSITGYPNINVLKNYDTYYDDLKKRICTLAKEYKINVIYGNIEVHNDNKYVDNTIFVNDNGIEEVIYARANKFWREDGCITGNKLKTIEVDGIKIGLMSGDDIYYPEIPRAYSLLDASAVICTFYGSNHRLTNSLDVKNALVNMVNTYGTVNEINMILCSANGLIEEDDNQSIIAGSNLVANTSVLGFSDYIKYSDNNCLDMIIDTEKVAFYKMISQRLKNVNSELNLEREG